MEQKNNSPQNYHYIEPEATISALKCLNTKFINALNPHFQPSLARLQKATSIASLQNRNGQKNTCSKHNYSTISILDHDELSLLEDFKRQESKSSSFTLTANIRHMNYTESMVINNENTISYYEDSFLEQSHAHPVPISSKISRTPAGVLKKQSQVKFGNGGKFKGEMKNGKMINGTFVLDSMFTYRGKLLNDRFHGQGTLSFESGHMVTCTWEQGKPTGHVTICYPHGQRYEGELQDFKKHGIGCLYFKDGSRYVGEFEHGEITGQGCYYSVSGEEQRGFWIKGQFQGQVASHPNQKARGVAGLREQQPQTVGIK